MAAKKKSKKKHAKRISSAKTMTKKGAAKKRLTAKRHTNTKRHARKAATKKKIVARRKKIVARRKKPPQRQRLNEVAFRRTGTADESGGQSGDLQGLSNRESADSESVDELLEEGNAFEADAVSGVEAADDADEQEVRTHEVPEDDVPEEYLDKD